MTTVVDAFPKQGYMPLSLKSIYDVLCLSYIVTLFFSILSTHLEIVDTRWRIETFKMIFKSVNISRFHLVLQVRNIYTALQLRSLLTQVCSAEICLGRVAWPADIHKCIWHKISGQNIAKWIKPWHSVKSFRSPSKAPGELFHLPVTYLNGCAAKRRGRAKNQSLKFLCNSIISEARWPD